MKMQFLAVAAAVLMAAPTLHAQATPATTPTNLPAHMGLRHGHMKELGLTSDQQAKMKAIHAKYAPQIKSARAGSKTDFDAMRAARTRGDTAAMRAARAKIKSDMAPSMQVRQQEMAEMRAMLTPAQQQKFDAQAAQTKPNMGKRSHGAWGKRAPKPANAVAPAK